MDRMVLDSRGGCLRSGGKAKLFCPDTVVSSMFSTGICTPSKDPAVGRLRDPLRCEALLRSAAVGVFDTLLFFFPDKVVLVVLGLVEGPNEEVLLPQVSSDQLTMHRIFSDKFGGLTLAWASRRLWILMGSVPGHGVHCVSYSLETWQ